MEKPESSGFTIRWLMQAALGALLVILLGVHLIVNHWIAPHGLLTYADIVRYYDNPIIVWMESMFLIVVTIHCLLGIHSIFLDLNLTPPIHLILTWILVVVGTLTILYGLWLIQVIVLRSIS